MNIINKALLKAFLLPQGFYSKLGVDMNHLKAILTTKLTMDDRRPSTIIQAQQNRKKPLKAATIGTMLISLLMGVAFLISFAYSDEPVTQFTIYFSMFFLMLSATLISDFTSVLIDVRDTFIILPKPVNDKTVVVSRLLHIAIHLSKIIIPMILPGTILITSLYGFAALFVFLIVVVWFTFFVLFFINAVYILILKITTPQKFQAIISYIQIIFAIAVYTSYQVLPQLMTTGDAFKSSLNTNPLLLLYPIYWFAAAWQVLSHFAGNIYEVIGCVLALIVPLLGMWLVVKYLAPSFNNKMAMIHGAGADTGKPATVKEHKKEKGYAYLLSNLLTRSQVERTGFLFTWRMMARSRDFKIKVYPSIGYLLVYTIIVFFRNRKSEISDVANEGFSNKLLVILGLYFGSFVLTACLTQMVYSEKHKASWVYHIVPMAYPGHLIAGGIKAAIALFYLPMIVLVTFAGVYFIGPSVLPNIALGLFNQLLISYFVVFMHGRRFPFSVLQQNDQRAGTLLKGVAILFVSFLIGLLHYTIYSFTLVVLVCTVLSAIATWLLMSSIRNSGWAVIRRSYVE